jgi:hypothetical protein
MRIGVWTAVVLLGIGASALGAQTQTQSQQPAAPASQMGGMDMGTGGADKPDAAKPGSMKMDHSMGMGNMGGMGHEMKMDRCPMMNPAAEKPPAGALRVVFAGKSADWTVAALAALPHITVSVFNSHAKANRTYSGVPLVALLTPLGVPSDPHGKDLRLYLVAEGTDGYMAVYSVAEANPDVHEATVLVADTMDGKALAESGPFQLVATADKRPARWVRNLALIRVLPAE